MKGPTAREYKDFQDSKKRKNMNKTLKLVLNENGSETFTFPAKLFYEMLKDYLSYASWDCLVKRVMLKNWNFGG